eukprot:3731409-Rhodomonas_salina.1
MQISPAVRPGQCDANDASPMHVSSLARPCHMRATSWSDARRKSAAIICLFTSAPDFLTRSILTACSLSSWRRCLQTLRPATTLLAGQTLANRPEGKRSRPDPAPSLAAEDFTPRMAPNMTPALRALYSRICQTVEEVIRRKSYCEHEDRR